MGKTGLVQDSVFQTHKTACGHPERPQRLARIAEGLRERGLSEKCTRIPVSKAPQEAILRVHKKEYLDRLEKACIEEKPYIDVPDSSICPASYDVALQAAGAVISAIDEVAAGRLTNAFCAIRPPGHHAERHMSMGFCLLNNIAIAAAHLLDAYALDRVLILDWDVHHGNGTQHIFESDPRVLFISLHGHPGIVYPGTGYAEERGIGRGEGFTLNIPILPPGLDATYGKAFDDQVLPKIEQFRPQFVLISAGFDAHALDPLAPLQLETQSFGWMTDAMTDVARRHCHGRLVNMLEGGYHLDALADCVALHVERLLVASSE